MLCMVDPLVAGRELCCLTQYSSLSCLLSSHTMSSEGAREILDLHGVCLYGRRRMARNPRRQGQRKPAQPQRRARPSANANPAIKNPALRNLIAGRTDQIKPFEWERLGKALDYLLEKILYEHSGFGEVSEWVRKTLPYDQQRQFTLRLLHAQDFGELSLQEQSLLFGKSQEALRQDRSRMSRAVRKQFPDIDSVS